MTALTPTVEKKLSQRAGFLLFLLFVVSLFNYTDRYMLAILIPDIRAEFGLSDTQIGFLTGLAFTIFYVVMGIPIARLADRTNRKNLLTIALASWSAFTAGCGLAQNFVQLLIARVLVGIGEAGASPPSYSLISDLYPRNRRAGAMSVYLAGGPAGILLGYTFGGALTAEFGWRVALQAMGILGFVFALIFYVAFREPARLNENGRRADPRMAENPGLLTGILVLVRNKAFIHVAMGCAYYNALLLAFVSWLPSFFVRSHGLGVAETGVKLAFTLGPTQLVGMIAGGYLADYLARFSGRWYFLMPGLSILVAVPLFVGAFLAKDPNIAFGLLLVPLFVGIMQTSPAFAVTQNIVPAGMRAVGAAVLILIINVVSGGLGPISVGLISDYLMQTTGSDSLRQALIITTVVFGVLAIVHYFLGAKWYRDGEH